MNVEPIGRVRSPRRVPEEDGWDGVTATIELDPGSFTPDAVRGLADFSHVEVVYVFHLVDPNTVAAAAQHPRGEERWPEVGVFAQRGTTRPNRLGVSICRLERVEGRTLTVLGLDALDGSPVLDVKPWVTQLLPRDDVRQPAWVADLMIHYWRR